MNCERLRKTATRHVEIHNYLVGWFRPRTLLDVQNLHDEQMVVVSVICNEGGVLSAFSRDVQRGLAHSRLCAHPRARDVRGSSLGSSRHVFDLRKSRSGEMAKDIAS